MLKAGRHKSFGVGLTFLIIFTRVKRCSFNELNKFHKKTARLAKSW